MDYSAYYRDAYIWLPDIRWEDKVNRTMVPCCPNCQTNARVGPHGFRENHFGRVVVALEETYYVISRRYICYECHEIAQRAMKDIEALVKEKKVNAEIKEDIGSYSFMGWDKRVLPLYPYGGGDQFPALLTWRGGIDKTVVKLQRPLFDAGVRPERLSSILLEMHSIKFTEECLSHEYEITRKKDSNISNASNVISAHLGDFGDKLKYRSLVPTGYYLEHVYKTNHRTIRSHLAKEVKKRGAEKLHWDVSYKEANHLCRYRRRPKFKGLVTALNEFGEVIIQFHIYTDSQ